MLQQLSTQIRLGILSSLGKLARNDATGGVIMLVCTVLALILQNGSYSTAYRHWLDMSAGISFGNFVLEKPLLLWINDGLITIFFFSIGLELKIEFIKGHLSNIRNIILPSFAAVGGIIAPSLVFILFNYGDDFAMNGWAIPTATDTAFSVALILLLGHRVPASLKIFLLSMAIFDDIGAILVIALFYTSALSIPALIGATLAILALAFLNYLRVGRSLLYFIVGILLWFSILKSGVHATLAGIVTAFFIPMQDDRGRNMVERMFEDLKVWVAMVVLPIFTIANAGVDLSSISIKDFLSPVSLGIFFGLVVGKQLGIFGVIWLCIKTRLVSMPEDANMRQVYGVCILTGIGFSMSMFIDSLAYKGSNVFNYADSLAILVASLFSGVYGFLFLRFYACKTRQIAYRPWLPAPDGYRGNATTANLFALEPKIGPSSVAPTAALVAAANARMAAANAAVAAANKAAAAAAEVAEAMQQVVTNQDDAETVAKVQAAVAAAAAAAADAAITSTKLDTSEDHEDDIDVVQNAAGAAQQAAVVALEVAEAAKVEAQAAKAAAKAEEEAKAEKSKADGDKSESAEDDDDDADKADRKHKDKEKDKEKSKDKNADDAESAESEQDETEAESEKDEDDGLSTRIIKTVTNVAKDTASIVADVASSILTKDDDDDADSDKEKAKSKKAKSKSDKEEDGAESETAHDEKVAAEADAESHDASAQTEDAAANGEHSETKQSQTDQSKTEQSKTEDDDQSKADLSKTSQSQTGQSKTAQTGKQAKADAAAPLDVVETITEIKSEIDMVPESTEPDTDVAADADADQDAGKTGAKAQVAEGETEADGAGADTAAEAEQDTEATGETKTAEDAAADDDAQDEEDGDLEGDIVSLEDVYQAALESRGIITDKATAVVITALQHTVAQSAQQLEVSALSKQERLETAEMAAQQDNSKAMELAIQAQDNTMGLYKYLEMIESFGNIETLVKQHLDLKKAIAESMVNQQIAPHATRLDLNSTEAKETGAHNAVHVDQPKGDAAKADVKSEAPVITVTDSSERVVDNLSNPLSSFAKLNAVLNAAKAVEEADAKAAAEAAAAAAAKAAEGTGAESEEAKNEPAAPSKEPSPGAPAAPAATAVSAAPEAPAKPAQSAVQAPAQSTQPAPVAAAAPATEAVAKPQVAPAAAAPVQAPAPATATEVKAQAKAPAKAAEGGAPSTDSKPKV